MLCRHNQYVQGFGQVRDATEVSRRERVWEALIERIELDMGESAGALSAEDFRDALCSHLDTEHFVLVTPSSVVRRAA
jgi:hypothetical protein